MDAKLAELNDVKKETREKGLEQLLLVYASQERSSIIGNVPQISITIQLNHVTCY